jgi:hypothetical protein
LGHPTYIFKYYFCAGFTKSVKHFKFTPDLNRIFLNIF